MKKFIISTLIALSSTSVHAHANDSKFKNIADKIVSYAENLTPSKYICVPENFNYQKLCKLKQRTTFTNYRGDVIVSTYKNLNSGILTDYMQAMQATNHNDTYYYVFIGGKGIYNQIGSLNIEYSMSAAYTQYKQFKFENRIMDK